LASIAQIGKQLVIKTSHYETAVTTEGYVSGVAQGSFLDIATGSRDPGFGLLIADFLLEPRADTKSTAIENRYPYHDLNHGDIAKRYVALPQICTQAKSLPHEVTEGPGFVAVRQWVTWNQACPPYHAGSQWEQTLLFPDDRRWFLSWDRFRCVDHIPAAMLRMDMPGHIRHHGGDVFRQIYLSYHGSIPQHEFHQNFPPDGKFLYRRKDKHVPERFIRAYQLENGVWLGGMALDPGAVYEAWCHQRDYVCFIEEIGGHEIRPGEWNGAVHLVGYFDDIAEMERVFDAHKGATALQISSKDWSLIR